MTKVTKGNQVSFPQFHPCHTIKDKQGNLSHIAGDVDDQQYICGKCVVSFTFWIDLCHQTCTLGNSG